MRAQEKQSVLKALQEARLLLERERTAMGQKLKESNDELLDAEREASRAEELQIGLLKGGGNERELPGEDGRHLPGDGRNDARQLASGLTLPF